MLAYEYRLRISPALLIAGFLSTKMYGMLGWQEDGKRGWKWVTLENSKCHDMLPVSACVCLCVSYLDLIASNFSSLPAWQPARIIGCHHELTALFTLVVAAVCYQLYQIHSLCVCSCMLKVPVLVVSSIIMAKKRRRKKIQAGDVQQNTICIKKYTA